ncbi:MAG TPA: heparan-alpha-glucosaminide N-acetyltransferase domain-containing protein, partial [Terriglobia bacterium]|nr:heparan-alpha-glucosaminide N-acetyltransferase domain-containing protein [Terriglobia bacterium]
VFLAGTSLALSVERRVLKGVEDWSIDKNILLRGAIIALLDPTIISLGSGRWTFQVLFAIGLSMMCMAPLRRLPTWGLIAFGMGWIFLGEIPTGWFWHPPGNSPIWAAFTMATFGSDSLSVKYPVIPWLAIMVLGWVFGRHLIRVGAGTTRVSGRRVLWISGILSLAVFAFVRWNAGYGDMWLHRSDSSWQQWLHLSKYPPSLTYYTLELGILFLALALLRSIELQIGTRVNGVFLVFGQTAMFFYLAHRLLFEVPATYFGLRGFGNLATTYIAAVLMLLSLYPACRWYRAFKRRHRDSFLRFV